MRALSANPGAWKVKVADLQHNSDLTRLDEVSPEDIARVQKYNEALELLYSPREPANEHRS